MIDDPGLKASTDSHSPSNVTSNNSIAKRKARVQLSCTLCRQGKLKCNKGQPACDQCLKRSRGPSCVYRAPAVRHKSTENVKGRIKHLERLVVDLMNSDSNIRSPAVSNEISQSVTAEPLAPEQARHEPGQEGIHQMGDAIGHMTISKGEMSYTGGLHWAAILDDVGFSQFPQKSLHMGHRALTSF